MKTIEAGAKYLRLFVLVLALASIGFAGCGKNDEPEYTKVKIKVASKDISGEAKTLFAIDPDLHPRVAVIVKVTASDLDAPIIYFFAPELVASDKGTLSFLVPSGQARTFTPMALEFFEGEQPSNVFPGVKYSPTTSASQRTVDLTGDVVVLNIDLMQEATTYLGGAINDDRTGTQAPIDNFCANPDVYFAITIPSFRGETVEIPVSVNTGGSYNISGVPMDLAIQIQARDATTSAAGTQDFNIPLGTTLFTQDVYLSGVTPLSLAPTTATTEVNGSVAFTPAGGIYPYAFSISPNSSGAYMEPPATVFPGGTASYVAGTLGGGRVDAVIVTDNCGATETASVTVNWLSLAISPTSANIAPYEDTTFTASGGSGVYSWGFSTKGCADSSIAANSIYANEGDYSAPSTGDCSDVIRLSDDEGTTPVTATVNVGSDLQITPTSVMAYVGGQVDFDATGGKTPYVFTLTSDTTGGATLVTATGIYTSGTSSGTSYVTVTDATGIANKTGIVHVVYSPLVISPLNPTITFGQSQTFAGSGGDGNYYWGIITQNCAGSSIGPTGNYMSPSSYGCMDTIQLTDMAGTTPTSTTITVSPPVFAIQLDPPTSIFTDDEVALSVSAINLNNAGDNVRFEVIHDNNGNGVFDSGEPTIKIFEMADGGSAPVYSKEPYDMDDSVNSVVSTNIPFYNPPHISGNYVLFATELSSLDTDEAPFAIIQNPAKTKIIGGQVTSGGTPQANAIVLLDPRTRKDEPLEWTWTDSSGNYTLRTSKTTGKMELGALKPGYLMDMNSAPVVDLSLTTIPTTNIDLTAADTITISGDVVDQTTAMGVPGIVGIIRSENGRYASVAATDQLGQFSFSVITGNSWFLEIFPYWTLEHGYVMKQSAPSICNVTTSTTVPAIYVNKGDDVITGGFSPATSVSVVIEMFDPANSLYGALYTKTVSDSTGNFEVPIVTGGTIEVRVDPFSLNDAGILAIPQYIYTGMVTPPFTAYFTVIFPYYHIYGQLLNESSLPVGGIPIFGYSTSGIEAATITDSNGNYALGAQMGDTWDVRPDNVYLMMRSFAAVPDVSIYVNTVDVTGVDFDTATSAANSRISGIVTDDASSITIIGAEVTLWESALSVYNEVVTVQTSCNGSYNLRAKQTATSYIMSANALAYGIEYWNNQSSEASADVVTISPPSARTGVNFALTWIGTKPIFGKTDVYDNLEVDSVCGSLDYGYNDPECCAAYYGESDDFYACVIREY